MKKPLFLIMSGILVILLFTGCSGNPAEDAYEDIYLEEAPGVRVTGEAFRALATDSETYTLSYTQRTT